MFEYAVSVSSGASELRGHHGAMVFAQGENAPGGFGRLPTYANHAAQKECKPFFPIAGVADGLEMLIVGSAVPFEKMVQIEHGLEENLTLTEEEGDEEPPDASVAVEERVNRLELGMSETNLNKQREIGWSV